MRITNKLFLLFYLMKIITYSISPLTELEVLCIQSWINHGYEIDFYSPHPTHLQVNLLNPDIICQSKTLQKINIPVYKNFFLKIKLLYHIGGIVIDPDVICLRKFDFPEKMISIVSIKNKYIYDFAISNLPRKSFEAKYMINHFFMLYNDVINEYNTKFDITYLLYQLVTDVFKPVKLYASTKNWKTLLDSKGLKNNSGFFLKIYSTKIYETFPNFLIGNYPHSFLHHLLVK